MTTDDNSIEVCSAATQVLTQLVFETGAVQSSPHADDPILWNACAGQSQVSHRIHRVTDYNNNGIRRVFKNILGYTFYNTCVYADQFFPCHTGFAGKS